MTLFDSKTIVWLQDNVLMEPAQQGKRQKASEQAEDGLACDVKNEMKEKKRISDDATVGPTTRRSPFVAHFLATDVLAEEVRSVQPSVIANRRPG